MSESTAYFIQSSFFTKKNQNTCGYLAERRWLLEEQSHRQNSFYRMEFWFAHLVEVQEKKAPYLSLKVTAISTQLPLHFLEISDDCLVYSPIPFWYCIEVNKWSHSGCYDCCWSTAVCVQEPYSTDTAHRAPATSWIFIPAIMSWVKLKEPRNFAVLHWEVSFIPQTLFLENI